MRLKKQESSGTLARAEQIPRIPAVGVTCGLRRPFCAELKLWHLTKIFVGTQLAARELMDTDLDDMGLCSCSHLA